MKTVTTYYRTGKVVVKSIDGLFFTNVTGTVPDDSKPLQVAEADYHGVVLEFSLDKLATETRRFIAEWDHILIPINGSVDHMAIETISQPVTQSRIDSMLARSNPDIELAEIQRKGQKHLRRTKP